MNSHAVIALLSDKGIHLHLCYRPYTILKKLLTSVYNLTIMQFLIEFYTRRANYFTNY